MKILVTGGAGFIGAHLIERLLKDDNYIISVDNFTLGKQENVDKFSHNNNFKFYNIDINNTELFCETLKDEKIDMLYHLAANSDIQKGGKDPLVDYNDTFMTTFSVLELMRRNNIKDLFFSSTSAIYGDENGKNVHEDLGALLPISYYGGAKFASENFISSYAFMNDLNVVTFRFPNVIGPNLTHGVIYDFVKKLKNNPNELEILGDGTQTKPYIYVTDLIDCIIQMTKDMKPGVLIYNVGVETATSVTRIADLVCEVLGYNNVKYNYTGGAGGWKGDVPKFQYDLSKIHSAGWKA
ncbi:MAG: NAD-dependent epimerase/dehydratase family protein, partial [Methanobacteriaceae archaeon]|nr:NAD-dependent epimerase/dehydratase family protein [Methanobacteriaceae archaeon]